MKNFEYLVIDQSNYDRLCCGKYSIGTETFCIVSYIQSEYNVFRDQSDFLNWMGGKGWQLVSGPSSRNYEYIFMREI